MYSKVLRTRVRSLGQARTVGTSQVYRVRRHTHRHHVRISILSAVQTALIAVAGASMEVVFVAHETWGVVTLLLSSALVVIPVLGMDMLEDDTR